MTVIRRKSASKLTEQREFFLSCAGKMEEIAKKELEDIAKEKKLKISSININKGGVYFRSSISDAFTAGLFQNCWKNVIKRQKDLFFI